MNEFFDSYSTQGLKNHLLANDHYKYFKVERKDVEDGTVVKEIYDSVREALQTGYAKDESGHIRTWKDLLQTKQLARFTEAALVDIVRSSIEPNLVVVPNLFSKIDILSPVPSIRISTVGPVNIHEIAEGGDYKESNLEMDEEAFRMDIPIRKYGGMITISDEALELNSVDLIRMWMQKLGTGFAQHKEKTGIQMINRFGKTVFDGANPSASLLGCPTGRGIDGAQNGTMSLYDFFDLYAHLTLRGFTPDTLLINPFAWKMFMTDPETREIFLKNGVLSGYRMPAGSYASGWGTLFNGMGERLIATGNPSIDPTLGKLGVNAFGSTIGENHLLSMLGNTFNIPPTNQFPGPLKVIVTPYVGFRKSTSPSNGMVTDIILADSQNCGILAQKENVSFEEFSDPWRDIRVTKARERYGFGILEQGKSIVVAKNIVIDRNYVFENVNSRTLSTINPATTTVSFT